MRQSLFFLVFVFLLQRDVFAADKIKVVATTTVLGDLVKQVAADRVEVYSIVSPKRDIHFYPPTPKDVLKVKKADVLVHTGLDLEAWRNPLLEAAGNSRFFGNSSASIDVSKGIALLEVPISFSRTEGDIHIFGNPHYWLDPENAKIMADHIADSFAKLYPEDTAFFHQNAEDFRDKIDQKLKEWQTELGSYRGTPIVTYHKSWPYFAKRFGFEIVEYLEPKPGIPPTAKHLNHLTKLIQQKKIPIIVKETFQENRTPQKLAKATGAKVVILLQAVNERDEAKDYISMMDYNVMQLKEALR